MGLSETFESMIWIPLTLEYFCIPKMGIHDSICDKGILWSSEPIAKKTPLSRFFPNNEEEVFLAPGLFLIKGSKDLPRFAGNKGGSC